MRLAVLLCFALLPLAGCADDEPDPVTPHAFSALYGPVGPDGYGMELTLEPATPQSDRDFTERAAYTLHQKNAGGGFEGLTALDAQFHVVRNMATCDGEGCKGEWMSWPDALEPNWLGVGWTLYPPADANRSLQDGLIVLERSGVRYEYEEGHLAPSRILHETRDRRCKEFPCDDVPMSGRELLAYDVTGALGFADTWPAPPQPLPAEPRTFLVHPGEDQDLFGFGWTTKDAMDHLATDPEAAAILSNGGCVLHFGYLDFPPFPELLPGLPVPTPSLQDVEAAVDVWLQDRDGASTRWHFWRYADALGGRFGAPEGDGLWPFDGAVSCSERAVAPPPRMDVADAWAKAQALMPDARERGFVLEVYHQPPDHGHGGFSPGNYGFEAHVSAFAREPEGRGSSLAWDLWRESLVTLSLHDGNRPAPP